MGKFSQEIVEEVRRKAAFRCCRFQNIGIHVHHIIPSKNGGSDDIDNAAPLCPTCHDLLGDNPSKRSQITQMRDWWYKVVENMYPTSNQYMKRLNQINSSIEQIKIDYQQGLNNWQTGMAELKTTITEYTNNILDNLNPGNISAGVSGIINTYDTLATGVQLGPKTYANVICNNCGTQIGLSIGTDNCPTCGQPIRSNF